MLMKGESVTHFVSVIGCVGSGSYRLHVGKSSLIHRFLSKSYFSEDHLSVLSPHEFDGEVVSGSHWLYWGELIPEFTNHRVRLSIIEQCEFVDDHLFAPMRIHQPYHLRCLEKQIHLKTRKLAYVCKDQLGDEDNFPTSHLEPGVLHISVFMCLYDITLTNTAAIKQAEFLNHVIDNLQNSNFPLILVTSKNDGVQSVNAIDHLENCLSKIPKRWAKKKFRLVETSAKLDVNVHRAFNYAASAALGTLNKKKFPEKQPVNKSDQPLKHLSMRLKRTFSGPKLHFTSWNSSTIVSPTICAFLTEPNDCFKFAYDIRSSSNSLVTNSKSPSAPDYSPAPIHKSHSLLNGSSHTPREKRDLTVSYQHSLGVLRSDNSSDVLETPPPLILARPYQTVFSPWSCPSSFSQSKEKPSTTSYRETNFQSTPSPTLNSFIRIYVYGDRDVVQIVVASLCRACPRGRFSSDNGLARPVWIFPGGSDSGDECTSCVPSSTHPSLQHSDGDDLIPSTVRPPPLNRNQLSKSIVSAFYIPPTSHQGLSTTDDTWTESSTTQTTQSTLLPSISSNSANSLQSSNALRSEPGQCERSHSPSSSPTSLCLRVLVYSRIDQLVCDSLGAEEEPVDTDATATRPHEYTAIIFWKCGATGDGQTSNLILSGIQTANRLQIPFISTLSCDSHKLLRVLLKLPNSETSHGSLVDGLDYRPMFWIALDSQGHLDVIGNLLKSSTTVHTSVPRSKYHLLASVALVRNPCNQLPNQHAMDIDNNRGPQFLPTTVILPSAIKHDSGPVYNSPTHSLFSPSVLLSHVQLLKIVTQCNHRTEPIYFLYYSLSAWPEIEMEVQSVLETCFSKFRRLYCRAIVLVELPEPDGAEVNSSQRCHTSLNFLQKFARTKGRTVQIINDFFQPNDKQNGYCFNPISLTKEPGFRSHPSEELNLMFLSIANQTTFEHAMYQLTLEGDPHIWSHVPGFKNLFDSTPVHTPNVSHPNIVPIFSNSYSVSSVYSQPDNPSICKPYLYFPTIRTKSKSTVEMVTLPWLPLSPDEVARLTSRMNSNACGPSVSIPERRVIPNHINNRTSSILEEYYSELPKIPARQPFTLNPECRRISRPSRPLPRGSSTISSSPSLLNELTVPSVIYRPADPVPLSAPAASSTIPTANHSFDLLNTDTGVYSEVNDAVNFKSHPPPIFNSSELPVTSYGSLHRHYDSHVPDPTHPHPRRLDQFSPNVNAPSLPSNHISLCSRPLPSIAADPHSLYDDSPHRHHSSPPATHGHPHITGHITHHIQSPDNPMPKLPLTLQHPEIPVSQHLSAFDTFTTAVRRRVRWFRSTAPKHKLNVSARI